jgi:hypothetical protein
MADIRIKDLTTNTPVLSTDIFVFEKNDNGVFSTSSNVLSTLPFFYNQNSTVTESFNVSEVSASGTSTTTVTVMAPRSYFLLDINSQNYLRKGDKKPTVTFYVLGYIASSTGGAVAEWDFFNVDTSTIIPNSTLTTANTNVVLLSSILNVDDFSTNINTYALRSRRNGGTGGTVHTASARIELKW